VLCAAAVLAAVLPGAASADEQDGLRQRLAERLPSNRVLSLRKLDGVELYEVVLSGNRIMYTDPAARVLLDGDLYELDGRTNLTEKRREQLNVVDFSKLPLDKAIVRVKGNGSRRMAVFADPDCPYCQQLERELEGIDDVTVYLFLYPIAELHPEAVRRARAVWCAQDRLAAWDDWMLRDREPPEAPAACVDPVAELVQLAEDLNVAGTPGIVFENGRMVPGVIPRADIEEALSAPRRS
jgi:thiol:disulfide interchange protein DsbC